MKTKKGILLLSTAMITGMLAGCGGQNVSESATGSSTVSSTEEAQKSTDTTSSAASDEKIVLKVLDNYQGGMVENMVSLYETLHPEIDIQYEFVPSDSYYSKFTALNVAGELPDVIMTNAQFIGDQVKSGLLMDLTDEVNNGQNYEEDAVWGDTFNSTLLDNCRATLKAIGTEYADKLIKDLDDVDYIEKVKVSQKNWIGRSEGAEVDFCLKDKDEKLRVYTTRPDTLFGATYMVISPEHPLIDKYKDEITNWDEIQKYREMAARKSDFERTELAKDKTGVILGGLSAVNPVNGKEIPVWISDYVLMSYGTGAIMAVPAHDTRDWEFAKKFDLPMIQVVEGKEGPVDINEAAFTDVATGKMINSDFLDGLEVTEAKEKMKDFLEEKGIGNRKVNYKLRDWVFSRQRYWGEPIPIVHCEKCGYVPLDESELPLLLPEVDSYMPTDNGESPLAAMTEWVNTTCPCCGGPAKRETDTMPQWAGSSWYFLRYTDPHNDEALASKEALKYWMPVDWYNGGMEHTTLHLLYSRFWHKFLYDQGVVPCPEPYQKRTSHGMILGENGEKMSKSRGNVVNPDDIVREYGADTLRTYEMFIGAFDLSASWSEDGVKGCRRFLERIWKLQDIMTNEEGYSSDLETKMHQTIKKVSSDYENLKYNTAIAAMMALLNDFTKKGSITKGEYKTLLILLNPVAPHITEELWQIIGGSGYVYEQTWPEYEEAKTVENTVEIAVQINGKTKGTLAIGREDAKEDVIAKAKESIADKLTGNIVKEIYVPGRIVNIVMK